MALLYILSRITADEGIRINNSSERQYAINRINDAARVLWQTNELKNSEVEQLFEFGALDQVIALPHYVDKVIACRNYDTRLAITMVDMRPRYMANDWRLPFSGYPYFRWRMKNKSPLKQNLRDASTITATLSSANSALFTVTITGRTTKASKISEVLVFPPGTTSVTTTNVFIDGVIPRKSAITDVDVTLIDASGNLLAEIPNTLLASSYQIVQVLDRNEYPNQTSLVEILYKPVFIPMQDDDDSFQCGDLYDEVIYWKTKALLNSNIEGKESYSALCSQTGDRLSNSIASNIDGPLDVKLRFGRNNVFFAFTCKRQSMITSPFGKLIRPDTFR